MQHQAQFEELDELSNYKLVNDNQDIRGAEVYSAATGQKIGEVDDMLVDISAELVKAVRLEDGTICSVDNIQIANDERVLYLDGTPEAVTAATTAGAVQLVQENLVVGTREVVGDAVALNTRVETDTVSETIGLRKESVHVETTTLNTPISASEAEALLQPQSISATAINEEVVVGKTAAIVGEVSLDKDIDMIQETVTDTVRKTVVDIDEDVTATATSAYAKDESLLDKAGDAIENAFDKTVDAAEDLID